MNAVFLIVSQSTSKFSPRTLSNAFLTTPGPLTPTLMMDILCEIGLEYAGAPGTTAALALLNDQVKKGGVMASSYVGGLSGAFIPVSEDQGMIDAVNAGALTLEKLEAMTCVCSVGRRTRVFQPDLAQNVSHTVTDRRRGRK